MFRTWDICQGRLFPLRFIQGEREGHWIGWYPLLSSFAFICGRYSIIPLSCQNEKSPLGNTRVLNGRNWCSKNLRPPCTTKGHENPRFDVQTCCLVSCLILGNSLIPTLHSWKTFYLVVAVHFLDTAWPSMDASPVRKHSSPFINHLTFRLCVNPQTELKVLLIPVWYFQPLNSFFQLCFLAPFWSAW